MMVHLAIAFAALAAMAVLAGIAVKARWRLPGARTPPTPPTT